MFNRVNFRVNHCSRFHDPLQGSVPIEASLFLRLLKVALLNCLHHFACSQVSDELNRIDSVDNLTRKLHRISAESFIGYTMVLFDKLAVMKGCYTALSASQLFKLPVEFENHLGQSPAKLRYLNSEAGLKFRKQQNHLPLSRNDKSLVCARPGCHVRTRFFCDKCQLNLCINFLNPAASCYHLWHTETIISEKLPVADRTLNEDEQLDIESGDESPLQTPRKKARVDAKRTVDANAKKSNSKCLRK